MGSIESYALPFSEPIALFGSQEAWERGPMPGWHAAGVYPGWYGQVHQSGHGPVHQSGHAPALAPVFTYPTSEPVFKMNPEAWPDWSFGP